MADKRENTGNIETLLNTLINKLQKSESTDPQKNLADAILRGNVSVETLVSILLALKKEAFPFMKATKDELNALTRYLSSSKNQNNPKAFFTIVEQLKSILTQSKLQSTSQTRRINTVKNRREQARVANSQIKLLTLGLVNGFNKALEESIRKAQAQVAQNVAITKRFGAFQAPTIYQQGNYSLVPREIKSRSLIHLNPSKRWTYGKGYAPTGTGLIPSGTTNWSSSSHYQLSPYGNADAVNVGSESWRFKRDQLAPYTYTGSLTPVNSLNSKGSTTNYAKPLVDSPSARKLVLWGIKKLMSSLKNLPMFKVARKATTDILRLLMLKYASDKDNPKILRKLAMLGVAFKAPESLLHILGSTFSSVIGPYIGFSLAKGFASTKGINIGNSFINSGFGKSKGVQRGFWQSIKDFFGPEQSVASSFTKDKFGNDIIEMVKVGGGFNKLKPALKAFGVGFMWSMALALVDITLNSFNSSVEQWVKQSGPGGTVGKKLQMSLWHGGKGVLEGGMTGGLIGAIIGAIPPLIGAFFTGGATLATLPGSVGAGATIGTKIGAGVGGSYGILKGLATDVSDIKTNTEITNDQIRQQSWWGGLFGGNGGVNPNPNGGKVVDPEDMKFSSNMPKGSKIGDFILTSLYGWRKDPLNKNKLQFHKGVDLAAPAGTNIPAFTSGKVISTGLQKGYGNTVVIQGEDGKKYTYAHMNPSVAVGAQIQAGDSLGTVATVGTANAGSRNTGSHLHLGVTNKKGQSEDPLKVISESQKNQVKVDETTQKADDGTRKAFVGAFTNDVLTKGFAFA